MYATKADDDCSLDFLEPGYDFRSGLLPDEAWEVFELNEETVEPEPELGDFWGVVDREG